MEEKKAKLQATYDFVRYDIDVLNGREAILGFMEDITGARSERDFTFHEKIKDHGYFLESKNKDPYKNATHHHRIERILYRSNGSIDSTDNSKESNYRDLVFLTWGEFVELGRPKTIVRTLEGLF